MAASDVVHHLAGVCEPPTLGAELLFDLRTLRMTRTPVEPWSGCFACASPGAAERFAQIVD